MKRGAPVTPRKLAIVVLSAAALSVASACTFLVKFDDSEDAGPQEPDDAARPEPTIDSSPPPTKDASAEAAPPGVCTGQPDGTKWGTASTDRCCKGLARNFAVEIDDKNCGVCGMECRTGQHCARSIQGYFYCVGCGSTGTLVNADCQTSCCSGDHDDSTVFANPADQNIGVCTASNCAGQCSTTTCPPPSQCLKPPQGGLSYVCVYQ